VNGEEIPDAPDSVCQYLEAISKPVFDQSKLLILNGLKRILKPLDSLISEFFLCVCTFLSRFTQPTSSFLLAVTRRAYSLRRDVRSTRFPAKGDFLETKITTVAMSAGLIGATIPAPARANDELGGGHKIKHVLLISVDGLHALDVARYVESHPTLPAELSGHGITYSNARTPANSDSFPGLLALVTGGSPVSHGLFYDVSYNRGISTRRTRLARGNRVTCSV